MAEYIQEYDPIDDEQNTFKIYWHFSSDFKSI